MPRKKKTTAPAVETKVEAAVEAVKVEETAAVEAAPAAEAAPAKKAAAKKAAGRKPAAEKKAAAAKKAADKTTEKRAYNKKSDIKTTVCIQYSGVQFTSDELAEKAKKESGVKSPKQIDVYVKPEENMVYYVVDGNAGGFTLA